MSWLSKQLKSAKKLVTHPKDWVKGASKTVGKAWESVDDFALPAIGFALGGPGGAALGGALAGGIGNGRPDLARIGLGAAGGYVGGGAVHGLATGGMQGLRSLASGQLGTGLKQLGSAGLNFARGGSGGVPGADGSSIPLPAVIGPGAGGGAGGWQGALGKVGSWAMNNPELILGGLNAYQGYQAEKRAGNYDKEALGILRDDYNARVPLRDWGIQGMMGAQAPDLSHLADPHNPYGAAVSAGSTPAGLRQLRSRRTV